MSAAQFLSRLRDNGAGSLVDLTGRSWDGSISYTLTEAPNGATAAIHKYNTSLITTSNDVFGTKPEWTWFCWVKTTTTITHGSLIHVSSLDGYTCFTVYVESNRVGFVPSGDGESSVDFTHDCTKWTHLCLTWDGTKLRFFIDGVLKRDNLKSSVDFSYSSEYIHLFKWSYGDAYNALYQGDIFDMCILDKCLYTADFTPKRNYFSLTKEVYIASDGAVYATT